MWSHHKVTNKITSDHTASVNPVNVARQEQLRNSSPPSSDFHWETKKERKQSEREQEPRFLPWCSEQSLHRWRVHPLVKHRALIHSSPEVLHLSSSRADRSLCPSTVRGRLDRKHERIQNSRHWIKIYIYLPSIISFFFFFCLPRALLMRAKYLSMLRYVQVSNVKPGWIAWSTCKISIISLVLYPLYCGLCY